MKKAFLFLALCLIAPSARAATEESFRVQILSMEAVADVPDAYTIKLRQFEDPYSSRPLRQPREVTWNVRYDERFARDPFLTREEYVRAIGLLKGCLAHDGGRFQLAVASGGFFVSRPEGRPREWTSGTLSRPPAKWDLPKGANRKELLIYTWAKLP